MGRKQALDAAYLGSRIYSKIILSAYDVVVLGLSNAFLWKCPTPLLVKIYDEHVSNNHLDVGVGTGYFLDRCRFPSDDPHIVLFDLNQNSLQVAAGRIARYRPGVFLGNVLEPTPFTPHHFDSIGINYVLHCLPGTMRTKAIVFQHLLPLLKDGGVVFGATLLGRGVERNFLSRGLMKLYNAIGAFSNTEDDLESLEVILKDNFREFSVRVVGCVALFVGRA